MFQHFPADFFFLLRVCMDYCSQHLFGLLKTVMFELSRELRSVSGNGLESLLAASAEEDFLCSLKENRF